MPNKITPECGSCGSCEAECPNKAINEGESIYYIDPARCTECVGSYPTPRCAEVCPVDACVPDDKHKESHENLLAKWKKLHPGETPK